MWGIFIHGRFKTAAFTEELAKQYLQTVACDGTHDGRCADWQDDGHKCNEIRQFVAVD